MTETNITTVTKITTATVFAISSGSNNLMVSHCLTTKLQLFVFCSNVNHKWFFFNIATVKVKSDHCSNFF